MNAIEWLKHEHEKAKAEFAKVLSAPADRREELWGELTPELKLHEQIEDACVYEPLSRDAAGTDPVLAQWRSNHQHEVEQVEGLIAETEALDAAGDEWLEKVKTVHASLQSHIGEEEGSIFPRIARVWDSARLGRTGEELEQMKSRKAGVAGRG